MVFGIWHHICSEHEWLHTGCRHGALEEPGPKPYLCMKLHAATLAQLRAILLDKSVLGNAYHYLKNRYVFPSKT